MLLDPKLSISKSLEVGKIPSELTHHQMCNQKDTSKPIISTGKTEIRGKMKAFKTQILLKG